MTKRKTENDNGPASSSSLWGDMFGLGPMLKMISDPNLGNTALAMMQAIMESAKANARIEAKLNAILERHGYDLAQFDNAAGSAGPVATVFDAIGRDGIGGFTPPSFVADNGTGAAADHAGTTLAVAAIDGRFVALPRANNGGGQ